MARRLILIGFVLCGLFYTGVAEARVCPLGKVWGWNNALDEWDCVIANAENPDDSKCSAEYKKCEHPRTGAPYCAQKDENGKTIALYKDSDCCSKQPYFNEEHICPEDKNQVGYGASCRDAKTNTVYWEFCGCSFGFVDTELRRSKTKKDM